MTVAMRTTDGALADGRAYILLSKVADAVALVHTAAETTTVHTFPANQTVRRPEAVVVVGINGSAAAQVGLVLGSSPWKAVVDPVTVTVTWFNATGGDLTPNVATNVDAVILGTS